MFIVSVPLLAMHIPDGFLSVPVAIVGWLLMALLVGGALRQTRDQLGERQIPLMGILAAFVFAAQMINFPVAGGTSGHLLGGMLAAALLGPWAAVLVMTSVVAVQALLFQDGGLLALGFNVVNMGILTSFVGYAAFAAVRRISGGTRTGQLIGAGGGAWLTVVTAAAATALELGISGTSPLGLALPAMIGVHVLIGLGEALITVGALVFIFQVRPDLLGVPERVAARGSGWMAAGLLISLAVAFVSPLANTNPDGLERVALDLAAQGDFDDQDTADEPADSETLASGEAPAFEVMPDYALPFIQNEAISTIAAGVIGVLIVAGVGYGVARVAGRRQAEESEHTA